MAQRSNFYYQGQPDALGATIGQSLGRALFGDPAAAQAQAEAAAKLDYYGAQSEEARAHAGLYGSQAAGQDGQNAASKGLPDLIASMFAPHAPPAPMAAPSDPLAPLPDAPGGFDEATFKAGLPAVIAAMSQMQGDKVDPNAVMGGLAAMFGSDELARRGMVAQGKTPDKDFALTPERADAIAQQGYGADYRKATAVATINNRDDIAVAQANHANDIPVANIRSQASHDVAQIRAAAKQANGAAKPPKGISASAYEMLFGDPENPIKQPGELASQAKQRGYNLVGDAGTQLRLQIIRNFQQSGNPADAVTKALDNVQRNIDARNAKSGNPVRIVDDTDFARLAPGQEFIGPDGKLRRKPQ